MVIPSWYPLDQEDNFGIFFREHAIALAKFGHQVGVIYPKRFSIREIKSFLYSPKGVQKEIDDGVNTLRSFGISYIPRFSFLNDRLEFYQGLNLYRQYVADYGKPDIIHVQSMLNAGNLAAFIKKEEKIPFVITEHSSNFGTGRLSTKNLKNSMHIASHADLRFGVSRSLCMELEDLLGIENGRWNEMPNMVEQRFFEELLIKNQVVKDDFRFLMIASLDKNKRVENAIQAFAHQRLNDRNLSLDIVGDGPDRQELESIAESLGLQSRIRFHGKLSRPEIVNIMQKTDSLVLASQYETFGVVIIEALAMGKPVIATKCGGPESIVREDDGYLVPVDDIDALSDAMYLMIENYNRFDPQNIRSSCKSRYSEGVIISKWTEVYDTVIHKSDSEDA